MNNYGAGPRTAGYKASEMYRMLSTKKWSSGRGITPHWTNGRWTVLQVPRPGGEAKLDQENLDHLCVALDTTSAGLWPWGHRSRIKPWRFTYRPCRTGGRSAPSGGRWGKWSGAVSPLRLSEAGPPSTRQIGNSREAKTLLKDIFEHLA